MLTLCLLVVKVHFHKGSHSLLDEWRGEQTPPLLPPLSSPASRHCQSAPLTFSLVPRHPRLGTRLCRVGGRGIVFNPLVTKEANMAASSNADSQATQAFPNPPSLYYKLYTDENVQSGRTPPPPPPVKGAYHMFGAPFDVSPCS